MPASVSAGEAVRRQRAALWQLRQERRDLQTQIHALKARLREVEMTYQRLHQADPLSLGRPPKPDAQAVAITKVLAEAQTALHYTEILRRLAEQEGLVLRGKNPGNSLRARLHTYPQFTNLGRGWYTLAS